MKVIKALTLSIGDIETPVVTKYQLGVLLHQLYRQKKYKGEAVNLQKDFAERGDLTNYLNKLLDEGVLSQNRELPSGVFSLLGNSRWEVEDVVCTIDPFCYVSHLSAMSYHGLTDRIPSRLFISSPGAEDWKRCAKDRMKRDLKEEFEGYVAAGLPALTRINFKKIGRTEVHRFNSKHSGAFNNVKNRMLRVSSIGRTFLDMLRNPELCGGINHVLQVFDNHAEKYIRLITDEINANGKLIDKVRAGYILDERMKIQGNEVVQSWVQFAQRGGSRKLDASSEYIPSWSDKWCLSINIIE